VKVPVVIAIRFLAVTILYFSCFAVVSGALLSSTSEQPEHSEASATLFALLIVSLINAALWTYVILRSRWAGWKLILSLVVVFYGLNTVMPQIETAYFITRLPAGMLPRLFLAGAVIAIVFVPLAVLILGKAKAQPNGTSGHSRPNMPTGELIAKLSLIVIAYIFIYFTFGYFVAWRNAAVRAYYGGTAPDSFIAHITSLLRNEPLLFLLQAVRALLWTALAVPVLKMMRGEWWESALAVALLFTVTSSQLLLPNPLMPPEVRMVHLLETATSNFLFGCLLAVILRSRRRI
jgi:hypothetical protein